MSTRIGTSYVIAHFKGNFTLNPKIHVNKSGFVIFIEKIALFCRDFIKNSRENGFGKYEVCTVIRSYQHFYSAFFYVRQLVKKE